MPPWISSVPGAPPPPLTARRSAEAQPVRAVGTWPRVGSVHQGTGRSPLAVRAEATSIVATCAGAPGTQTNRLMQSWGTAQKLAAASAATHRRLHCTARLARRRARPQDVVAGPPPTHSPAWGRPACAPPLAPASRPPPSARRRTAAPQDGQSPARPTQAAPTSGRRRRPGRARAARVAPTRRRAGGGRGPCFRPAAVGRWGCCAVLYSGGQRFARGQVLATGLRKHVVDRVRRGAPTAHAVLLKRPMRAGCA